jgi:hypothetical protein
MKRSGAPKSSCLMTDLRFEPKMCAVAVEAGVTLGEAYRKLYFGLAGESPDIGFGGHVVGGAFGLLCRKHGLAGDHLHAVEVVVVHAAGTARSVVATREPTDPNRALWRAHNRRRQLRHRHPLLAPHAEHDRRWSDAPVAPSAAGVVACPQLAPPTAPMKRDHLFLGESALCPSSEGIL